MAERAYAKVKGMIAPWGAQLSQNAAKYAIIDFGQVRKDGASIVAG